MVVGTPVVFFLAAALALATSASAARRRRDTAGSVLTVGMLPIALWCAASAVLRLPVGLDVQLVARWSAYVGILGTTTAQLVLAHTATRPDWRPKPWVRRCLWLVPSLLLVALATNSQHGLFFADVVTDVAGHPPRLRWAFGPLFWVHSAYCYGMAAWSIVVLLRARRRATWYFRRQLTSLVLSATPPFLASVLSIAFARALDGVDCAPLGFVVTGLVISRALFSQGLFSVVPIARGQVLEKIADAVVVIDSGGHIVDVNAQARRLAARLRPELPPDLCGRWASELFTPDVMRPLGPTGESRTTAVVGEDVHLDARTRMLHDGSGRELGRVVVLRDVTEEVLRQQELEAANRRLLAQQDELAAANGRLSEQLAVNELLRARLSEDVVRDPLTGLHNRRRLTTVLAQAQERVRDGGRPFSVVVLDVDHFKRVNDTYGHAAGDEVLKAVAGVLVTSCRASDTVVRYGGEEFVVVLPETDALEAGRRAEEMRACCAAMVVRLDPMAGVVARVTVSAGVSTSSEASLSEDEDSATELLAAADAALYRAKQSGRDRVVVAAVSAPAASLGAAAQLP